MSCPDDTLPGPELFDRPVVLVIEDDPGLGQVLGVALQARGLDVTYASDGPEAVAIAMGARPDLLVLDVSLRTGRGFNLLEHLQDQPALAALPLVVYSARELDDLDRSRLVLGRTAYLTKGGAGMQDLERHLLDLLEEDQ
jgi:CheY-like chemotaxis protein